jgi:hypothetical protein
VTRLNINVGIKWNVGGCKLEKNKNKSDKQIMIFINHIKYYHGHNYKVKYKCPECSKVLKTISGFRGHVKKQHNIDGRATDNKVTSGNKSDFISFSNLILIESDDAAITLILLICLLGRNGSFAMFFSED